MKIKFFLLLLGFSFSLIPVLKGCTQAGKEPVSYIKRDSVRIAPGKKYKKNFIHNFIFGKHYRDLWATEVNLPVFKPDEIAGGLKAVKLGGSFQTVSIHLEDSTGKRYVLRSVDKDPYRVLPVYLRATALNQIIADQTSASNPFAALIVDDLSEAAGLYHTNPIYYYIPEGTDLNSYGEKIQGKIGMFEEKPNGSWKNAEVFSSPDNIYDTEEMLGILLEKQNAFINQKLFLRSRLFDLLINDWDRHSDQWEWLKFEKGDSIVFDPLPRDRDAAFYMFDDGILPFLASRWWGNTKFQSFHAHFEDVSGLLVNSSYVDNLFLNKLTKEDWLREINALQQHLSDQAIESAVKKWPKEVYEKAGEETTKKLIARRGRLEGAAMQFYELVNQHICITGTDKNERIRIERTDACTNVTVTGKNNKLLYSKSMLNKNTKTINIFTLGGEDEITVTGNAKKGVIINIYGGKGNDKITDQSFVQGITKKTRVYDSKDSNRIEFGKEADDRTSNDPDILTFNRTGERKS